MTASADVPPGPHPHRRGFSALAAFMEERNILWGELVGGLLVVGCSVALVVSLWSTFRGNPLFQFATFTGAAAAVYGAGLYTLRRWRLESTSRGLLLIALLLTPVDLLALTLPGDAPPGPLDAAVQAGSLLVLLPLAWRAGRVLVHGGAWLLAGAVTALAACHVALAHAVHPGMAEVPFAAWSLLPAACFGLAVGAFLVKTLSASPLDGRGALGLFLFLGVTAFALVVALGNLLFLYGDVVSGLGRLGLTAALAALPLLAAGTAVHNGLAGQRSWASYRTAGTTVALAGMVAMLLAVAVSWPRPVPVLAVCIVDFVALSVLAFRCRMPAAHAVALPCLAVGWVMGSFLLRGLVDVADAELPGRMLTLVAAPETGTTLLVLFAICGLAAEILARRAAGLHALSYGIGAVAVGLGSVALATYAGLEGPGRAALVYATVGLGTLVLDRRRRLVQGTWLGLVLLVGASLWGLWWACGAVTPAWGTVLAGESLVIGLAGILRRAGSVSDQRDAAGDPLAALGSLVGLAALAAAGWSAWQAVGAGLLPRSPLHAYTADLLALVCLVQAWRYGTPLFTWAGSAFLLVGTAHLLAWGIAPREVPHSLLAALLTHATIVLAAGFIVQGKADVLRALYVQPLSSSAFLGSLLAVPLLVVEARGDLATLAPCAAWLGLLWLALAWMYRWKILFAAFQAALGLAIAFALTAWLSARGRGPAALDSLPIHGLGIGLLILAFAVVRQIAPADTVLGSLLRPAWISLDRAALAVLIVGQLGASIAGLFPGVVREMLSGERVTEWTPWLAAVGPAAGWPAWALVGLLAVVLCVEGRSRVTEPIVLGLLVLVLTVPVLAARGFAEQRAAATALRWGLAVCFLACSLPLWFRERLGRRVESGGLRLAVGEKLAARARRLLVVGTVVPVLALALAGALLGFHHLRGPGPEAGSLFGRLGRLYSGVVPLGMVCAGLVVHSLRDRLAGYAFTVGLGGNLVATLIVRQHRPWAGWEDCWIALVQANAIAFGTTALLWLSARRRLYGERGEGVLLGVQVGLGLLTTGALLAAGLVPLVVQPGGIVEEDFPFAGQPGRLPETIGQVGTAAGWLALLATFLAGGWYARVHDRGRRWREQFLPLVCVLGLALGVLAACTAARWDTGNWLAFHVLGGCWAAVGLGTAAAGWLRAARHGEGTETKDATAGWTAAVAALLVALAMLGLGEDPWQPWGPVGLIATASVLSALLAVWRRRESWALLSAAGLETAVALTFFVFRANEPLGDWWPALVQGEAVTAALAALAWLAACRAVLGTSRPSLAAAPLLAVQVALPMAANLALLAGPLATLLGQPGELTQAVRDAGSMPGWLALGLALATAAWYAGKSLAQGAVHVLCSLGLVLGVLIACTAARWDHGHWLAYHVLTACWAAVAVATLAAGSRRVRRFADKPGGIIESVPRLPAGPALGWVVAAGALVLGLALRGMYADPTAPWSSCGALVFVSGLAADLALGRRRDGWAFLAGWPLYLAVSLVLWHQRQPWDWERDGLLLAQANLMTAGLVALAWLALRRRLYGQARPGVLRAPLLGLQAILPLLGTLALLAAPLIALVSRPEALPAGVARAGGAGGWLALAAAVAPAAWYAGGSLGRMRIAAASGLGLLLGVLLACTAARWDGGDWLAFRVLTLTWAAVGMAVLVAGRVRDRPPEARSG